MGIFEHLIHAIFPPLCRVCQEGLEQPLPSAKICDACLRKVVKIEPPVCPTCGAPLNIETLSPKLKTCDHCPPTKIHFESARAFATYDGVVSEIVKLLKFRYKTDVVPLLSEWLLIAYEEHFSKETIDFIVPVPLHWMRKRDREWNQAELLGALLSGTKGIPMETDLLARTRRTTPQSSLNKNKRIVNLRGAFAVGNPKRVAGQRVLIVDDVYTTGTTVNECARVLKEAGAKNVYALTVARTT